MSENVVKRKKVSGEELLEVVLELKAVVDLEKKLKKKA